jgi:transcriptional regulator with XRE-family HTH domain
VPKLQEKVREWLPRTWSPNQVVAFNLARARALRGWTQEQAADLLAPYLGSRLSLASFSAIERSIAGTRVKQFSADELVALSRVFEVPLGWWFTPPPDGALYTPDHEREGLSFAELVDLALGTPDTLAPWVDALRQWSAAQANSGEQATRADAPARTAYAQLRAQTLIREQFGDLGEASDVLRRLADVIDRLDDATSPTTRDAQPLRRGGASPTPARPKR